MTKILATIEARMTSKRLPGKVLKKINNKYPIIELIYLRVMKSKLIDELKETDEESYKRFKTSLGRASVSLQERQVELQNYMVQLLEAKNNKEGYMSTAMFREFENQGDMGVIGRYLSHLREVNHPLVSMFSQLLDQINYNVVKERQSMQKEIDGYNEKLKEWGKTKGLKGLDIYSMILNKKKE